MSRNKSALYLVLAVTAVACTATEAARITAQTSSQVRSAIRSLKPGDTLLVEPGNYTGGIHLANTSGTEKAPITICGADPNNPPLFSGGSQAIHLADCSYITLSNLKVKGFPANGINIDDAGSFETPAHHITVENVTILETGPKGNHDALKISGVDHFTIRRNAWHNLDGTRRPALPTPEKDGIYQPEINLRPNALNTGEVRLKDKRLRTIGAAAYTRPN